MKTKQLQDLKLSNDQIKEVFALHGKATQKLKQEVTYVRHELKQVQKEVEITKKEVQAYKDYYAKMKEHQDILEKIQDESKQLC